MQKKFSVVTESDIALGDRKGLKVLMLCQPFQLWGCSQQVGKEFLIVNIS
jgi:hypothetical protein